MQARELYPDFWAVIFQHLEPCFLADVARVSHSLNDAAAKDTIYYNKLMRYFPEENWQEIPVPEGEARARFQFKSIYAQKFATLKSSASRRLFSFVIEEDIEQIRNFKLTAEQLYEIESDKDADGRDILFYCSRTKNPEVGRALLFLCYGIAKEIRESWNPLTMLTAWMDDHHILGVPASNLPKIFRIIYMWAAAFNHLDILHHIHELRSEDRVVFLNAVVSAIRFGHIEAVDVLLSQRQQFRWSDHVEVITLFWHACAHNQIEVVKRLLEYDFTNSQHTALYKGLEAAIEFGNDEIGKLLLTAFLNYPKSNFTEKKAYFDAALPALQEKGMTQTIAEFERFANVRRLAPS